MQHPSYRISLIVAMANNNVIGHKGALPWRLKNDLQYFKKQTLHKTVIMGRKTAQSIGKLLPERYNIIVTRNTHFTFGEAPIASSVEQAVDMSKHMFPHVNEIMIIGGAQIYQAALGYASRLYITHIDATIQGDTYFSVSLDTEWICTHKTIIEKSHIHAYRHIFCIYDKSPTQ